MNVIILVKPLKKLYIPGAGHHSLVETESGDYLINSSDRNQTNAILKISSIYLIQKQERLLRRCQFT